MNSNAKHLAKVIDTTLREGEQSPGLHFDVELKREILKGLVELGVDEIELGIAVRENGSLKELAEYVHAVYPGQNFSLWCRCLQEDIDFGTSLKPDCLALSIPASDLHLQKKLGRDRKWAVERLRESVCRTLESGVSRVAVGLEDASRADPDFILELAHAARESGAFRLRLADTVGIATPAMIGGMLAGVQEVGIELGVHCHNDFGMATANTITAFEKGALWGDVTILGLGERTGNSRLEEVLSYLVLQRGSERYDLQEMVQLCRNLSRKLKREIVPCQPIIGEEIFSCETGMHLQGLLADPATYEPFNPERVGARRSLLIGAQTGRHAIASVFDRLGLVRPSAQMLKELTNLVRRVARQRQSFLNDHEVVALFSCHFTKQS